MKKFYFLILLAVIGMIYTGGYAQVVQVKKNVPAEQVNPRVDNMGYWMRMAEKGLIPYTPDIPVKPAEFKGTWIEIGGAKVADSPDIPVTNLTNVTESENSIFVDPDNNQYVLNSNNSTSWSGGSVGTLYGANYFQSANGGATWMGSYNGAGGSNSGDPTTAISRGGRQFVNFINNPGGQSIAYSDNGTSWNTATIAPNPGSLADKNHMWIDNCLTSPYLGNLYTAWTDFGGSYNYQVVFSRSTNNGVSWSTRIPISGSISTFDHGVNLQTGPNGEVYACWATYPSSGLTEDGIGFTKSTNGGTSFTTPVKAISNIKGIRETGVLKYMRVNSFPSMAVDVSGGANNGTIYIVWTNIGTPGTNTGTNKSIYIIKSTNGGTSWSTPVKVNQGPFTSGKEAYFPWITCDPETGALAVVFYDDRNTSSTMCETWVAYSLNGGTTWTDFRVSDVAFTPNAIPGLASSYMGDYLGITSKGGRIYPCWTDTRNGLYMTYVSPFELGLNAAFSANITSVCTGNSVIFTDQSSGPPTSWTWSFPGGTPSSYSGQNPPAITYSTPGTYDVTLTVSNGATSDTETKTGYITVNNVIADFTGTPTTVVVGNSVTFTDNSSCSPTSWTWSFPGGTPSSYSGQTPPAIAYNTAGTYNVSLTVSKPGSTDTETKTNYINVINCSYCASAGSNASEEWISNVTFNTINNNSSGAGYQDFTSISTNVFKGSSYNLSATISFNGGPWTEHVWAWIDWNKDCDFLDTGESYDLGQVSAAGTLTISIPVPTTAATGSTRMRVSQKYNGDPTSCETFSYGDVEDYTVNVMSGTVAPVANFAASTTTPAVGQTVTFTDLSTNTPTSWSWAFTPGTVTYVGGTNSTSQNPLVQFNAPGFYTVTLTATNAAGSDGETKTNYIYALAPPVANFSANNTTPAVGQTVLFTDLSTNTPTSWSWSFAPGTVTYVGGTGSTSQHPQVTFNAPGYYTVTLTATNAAGSDGETKTNYIWATAIPVANFSASNTTPLIGTTVNFTDLSTNTPTSWAWTFSPNTVTYVGGTNSTSQNPQVQFNAGGYYTVTLTATNAYGSDGETKTNYINVTAPPVANFSANNTTPLIGQTVTFTDLSTNTPTSWQWFFSPATVTYVGGTSSTSQHPQVQFTAGGYYTVSLVATNAAGSGGETKTNYIAVTGVPVANFTASTTTPVLNQTVTFTDLSTNLPTGWSWTFTPGTVAYVGGTSSTSQNPQVQFTAGGYYTVSLTVTNAQGSDNETKTNYINVMAPPVANFTASTTTPVLNQTVTFTDLSTNSPTSWSWSFSPNTVNYVGGTTSASQHPQVKFTAGGYYTVTLTATNAAGSDGETKTNYIFVVTAPVANFTADDVTPVTGQTVTFTDLTTNSPTSWAWSFTPNTVTYVGGTSSVSQNPQVQFTAGGFYTVTLTATNAAGSDGETKTNYINVTAPPVANFSANTTTPLAGQTVVFTDLTTNNPASWSWTFTPNTVTYVGGTTSTSQNPQVHFNAGGYYTVTLTATNAAGSDTETKTDYISVTAVPVADFSADDVTPNTGQTVTFTDLTTNTPTSWTWSFSPNTVTYTGGTTGTSQHPQVQFTAGGYYTVTLTASNAAGSDTEAKTNYILVTAPPVADFTADDVSPNQGATVTFTDLSSNTPISWTWTMTPNTVTYVGGTTAFTQNPQVQFDAPGYYTVTLQATNAAGSDTETRTDYIYVTAPPVADFTASNTTPLTGETVMFTDLSTNDPTTWLWSFVPGSVTYTGGTTAVSQNPQVQFDSPGYYTVSLTVTNAAGSDTETRNLYIYVTSPYITLELKALIEGPFNGTGMNTNINTYLPLSHPYGGSPWNYGGTESVGSIPGANVVDWVLAELRETTGDATTATASTVIARQAGFILSDGTITSADGITDMQFNVTVTANLYVVIWHRNHLGIMSSVPVTGTGGVYSYDFSPGSGQVYGGSLGYKELATGIWGMYAGDGDADGQVTNNDKNAVWQMEVGLSGYYAGDFNLDSQVTNIDKTNVWRPNAGKGSQVPN